MRLADYQFDLPPELIASHPAPQRDGARMLVLNRADGSLRHARFRDFPDYLQPGDLCVLNNARVVPARVFAESPQLELLVLQRPEPQRWICLVKPGRRARVGREVVVGGQRGRVVAVLADGERVFEFEAAPDLEAIGHIPLPPYIDRPDEQSDRERYQTVFARAEAGAIAAPTAGLHFTPEILQRVPHTFVTLQVGAGTFKPVAAEDITQHAMHQEDYEVTAATADAVAAARRVVAIGTTTVRVLESCPRDAAGRLVPGAHSTRIFLHPPHALRHTDALLTNFHLPGSTLIMLVSAFVGRERTLQAYAEAVRERYRFFSYGDCMLIL
ncbi:MAG: tRNA preQ1(34) S-adenosylmethionine ribosyltransferase-isomerase QueA [Verrucomicrobia bacterium]|nr:tRNA preQ1(34) S-adenosylmethionine ribosyltransferase-isomerase QueA [Verrucomicrobiota bacterium]